VLATVVPRRELDRGDRSAGAPTIDGVVGQDVLASLRYTIDYRRQWIVWHDTTSAVPRGASVVALEARDDRFVAVLPQDGWVLRLVPDTGADALVLFEREDRERPFVRFEAVGAELSSLAGHAHVRCARIDDLRVGSVTLHDYPVAMVARASPEPARGDGLLPLHIFARVTFEGPERRLVIER